MPKSDGEKTRGAVNAPDEPRRPLARPATAGGLRRINPVPLRRTSEAGTELATAARASLGQRTVGAVRSPPPKRVTLEHIHVTEAEARKAMEELLSGKPKAAIEIARRFRALNGIFKAPRCTAQTRSGTPCGHAAMRSSKLCWQHRKLQFGATTRKTP